MSALETSPATPALQRGRSMRFVRENSKKGSGWLELEGELASTAYFTNLEELLRARDLLDAAVREQLEELGL